MKITYSEIGITIYLMTCELATSDVNCKIMSALVSEWKDFVKGKLIRVAAGPSSPLFPNDNFGLICYKNSAIK